jgi:hypothetical protein
MFYKPFQMVTYMYLCDTNCLISTKTMEEKEKVSIFLSFFNTNFLKGDLYISFEHDLKVKKH